MHALAGRDTKQRKPSRREGLGREAPLAVGFAHSESSGDRVRIIRRHPAPSAVHAELGIVTGWALPFKPGRFEGGGMRFLRFKRWLTVEEGVYDQAKLSVNNQLVWQNAVSGHHVDSLAEARRCMRQGADRRRVVRRLLPRIVEGRAVRCGR